MIGHALLMFKPDAEDRILTTAMRPFSGNERLGYGGPCLIMAARGDGSFNAASGGLTEWEPLSCELGRRFDALCLRFGIERVTAAIRNRILSNRARRALAPRHFEPAVEVGPASPERQP